MVNSRYRLYSMFGKPVFVAPMELRRTALQLYHPFTIRRLVYCLLLRASMLFGADRFLSSPVDWPLQVLGGFDFDGWLDSMYGSKMKNGLGMVIFFPSEARRNRIYVHILDRGHPVCFAKIAKGNNNVDKLQCESSALRVLNQTGLKHCRIPRYLDDGYFGEYYYLTTEPLPVKSRPLMKATFDTYPSKCVEEYSGMHRKIKGKEVGSLTWWPRYQSRNDEKCTAFNAELDQLLENAEMDVTICRAHGDFSVANMVYEGSIPWIFDWEASCPDAPHMIDPLSYKMSINFRSFLANPDRGNGIFRQLYTTDIDDSTKLDVMMALAYRHAAGVTDATYIIHHWNLIK